MALTDEDKQWIDEKLDRLSQGFNQGLEQFSEHFDQKLERVETKLLTAFHQWASPIDMRQRTHTATLKAIDAEMEALANRVTKLEERAG